MDAILDYWLRFGINLMIITFLVLVLYCRRQPSRDYAISVIIGGALVYVLILLMVRVEIGLGVGFGIFAIFSLLRFRTVTISLRDMTYLFAAIAISLVNALLMYFRYWEEMAAINLALLTTLAALESGRFLHGRNSFVLVYDNLALLHPANRAELFADIRERTGIMPVDIAIDKVNFKRKTAELRLWHFEQAQAKTKEKPTRL